MIDPHEAPYWIVTIVDSEERYACVVANQPCDYDLLALTVRLERLFSTENVIIEGAYDAPQELPLYPDAVHLLGEISQIIKPLQEIEFKDTMASLIHKGMVRVALEGRELDAWTFWALQQTTAVDKCLFELTEDGHQAISE